LKAGIILALAAGFICAGSTPVSRDTRIIDSLDLPGLPIHALPDDKAIEAFRAIGYSRSVETQIPHSDLLTALMDQCGTPTCDYVSALVLHNSELIAKGTGNSFRLRFYQAILQDAETMRWYQGVYRFSNYWREELYGRHDLSPELVKRVLDHFAEDERRGLGPFAGPSCERMADWCFMKNQDEEGLRWLQAGLAANIKGEHVSGMSQIAGRIGMYHLSKGDLTEAEEAILQSYWYASRNEDPYYMSRSLAFLAELRARQGHFADAESLLVRSIEYARSMHDPSIQLYRLADLAQLHFSLGEYEPAEALIEKAIPLGERCLSDASAEDRLLRKNAAAYYLARCIELRGQIRLAEGSAVSAIAAMREALAVAKKNVDWRLETGLTKSLGDACAAAGREKEAVRCYERAIANAHRHHEQGLESEYLSALGEFRLDRSDYRRAEECLKRSAGLAEKPELWMEKVTALHLLARSRARMHDHSEPQRLLDESIATFEQGLAGKRFAEDRHTLNKRIRAIFADLLALQSGPGADCDSLLFTAEKARQLRSGARGIHQRDLDPSIAECLRSRDWIPENALIIQYIVTPEKLIIATMDDRGSSFRTHVIREKRLEAEVRAFADACRTAAGDTVSDSAANCREAETQARSLYAFLIQPIDSLAAGKKTLCFISDEPLRRIPFGALLSPGPGGRFLVESKNVLASPNLLSLRAASRRHDAGGATFASPLILGEPEVSECLLRNYPALERLSNARNEMIEIRNAVGRATVLAGPLATKEAALAELPKADLIHIATHRVTYPALSGRTALLFSTENGCDISLAVETSLLTENEIGQLNLSGARLVVLSACESAAAENGAASESMGLAGAFLDAGAQAVVATVWPVEDEAAKDFAIAFYRELIAGKSDPEQTLQATQRRIIQKSRLGGSPARDIQSWAPYLIIGSLR
jgi:CHAT domain-containing protein/tetratricopeptide (TPR) repeat protein